MVTVSSGSITIQALISPECAASSPQGRTPSVAASARPGAAMPSAKPPVAVSEVTMNWRRERPWEPVVGLVAVMVISPISKLHRCGGAMHRATEPLVGTAAAYVGEVRVDVGVGRIGVLPEIGRDRHDLARLAVTALRDFLGEPGLPDRMLAVGRQALDRRHLGAGDAADRHRAGTDGLAIHMDRAGAASGDPAAEL